MILEKGHGRFPLLLILAEDSKRVCPHKMAPRASAAHLPLGCVKQAALPIGWCVRGLLDLTRFLDANRDPPRIKSGAGFRLKTL
jgi:hypothetical protein